MNVLIQTKTAMTALGNVVMWHETEMRGDEKHQWLLPGLFNT
jgi:hypothetical protein